MSLESPVLRLALLQPIWSHVLLSSDNRVAPAAMADGRCGRLPLASPSASRLAGSGLPGRGVAEAPVVGTALALRRRARPAQGRADERARQVAVA